MKPTFANVAAQLCGQMALLLGWRPHEFWAATPAELACILDAMKPQTPAPLDGGLTRKLQEQFPDG
jgi:hypothetical protein